MSRFVIVKTYSVLFGKIFTVLLLWSRHVGVWWRHTMKWEYIYSHQLTWDQIISLSLSCSDVSNKYVTVIPSFPIKEINVIVITIQIRSDPYHDHRSMCWLNQKHYRISQRLILTLLRPKWFFRSPLREAVLFFTSG